jgi:hypothetical protein
MPKETNSGYEVAVSKSRPEYHRTALGGARPLIQRPKTVKSKRFMSNTEKMGKNTNIHQMVFHQSTNLENCFFCKNNNIFSFVPFLQ